MSIAVDAMGGDNAPQVNVDGAVAAAREFGIATLLVGRTAELTPLLIDSGYRGGDIHIVDAPEVVTMDEHPVAALRKKRNSSIRVAANCVRDGRAEGLVSAGNTGAAMVAAKMVIGTIEGVDRPALATVLPNLTGHCLLLDVGANPEAKTQHFKEFAVMGSIYAQLVFGKASPSIGLMSIGEEDTIMRLLLLIPLAALLLAGCAIVPIGPYAYAPPRPRVTYVYPGYPHGWYAPRYYGHW